jgi:hypothetical protein
MLREVSWPVPFSGSFFEQEKTSDVEQMAHRKSRIDLMDLLDCDVCMAGE